MWLKPAATAVFGTLIALVGVSASAQLAVPQVAGSISVLMLSDLHFDPFRDPAQVTRLAAAPAEQWDRILNEPNSAAQPASYAALETACPSRGEDTALALLNATLTGAKAQAADVRFVTVSGDLLVHQFECRYRQTMKGDDDALAVFAEKTENYVIGRVEAQFPSAAVFVTLGNNDSGCGDYRMNLRDPFLAGTAGTVARGWKGAGDAETKKARQSYERGGYYSVALPGFSRTRLLILNQTYLSAKYANCAGEKTAEPAHEELAWLEDELQSAQRLGTKVWVLGHIPPGVNVYATIRHLRTMCTAAPEMFLESDALATALERHGDVIRLAIFGHTHTDELRVLGEVPVKLVASVSPIDGNTPSFTVAQVDPATATLNDYAVFTASNPSGPATAWTHEYSFRAAYGQQDFSAKTLRRLIATFRAEPNGPASAEYERDFFGGDGSPLPLVWEQYLCALNHSGSAAFHACMCPAP